jgi:hypothetical protein
MSEKKPSSNTCMVEPRTILGHQMNHKMKKMRNKKKRLVQDPKIQMRVIVIVKAVLKTHQQQVLQNRNPSEPRITRKENQQRKRKQTRRKKSGQNES